jgi:NDP-sugar pyrophosphorylase family protein
MHIIIPMSGNSELFLEAGYTLPKPLIDIDGKLMIEYVVDMFSKEDTFTFICNKDHIANTNMKEVLTNLVPNFNIFEIDTHTQSPVQAITQVFSQIPDTEEGIIISYCDYTMEWDYNKFKNHITENNLSGAVVSYTGFHPEILGDENNAYMLAKDNKLIEIQEKVPYKEFKFDENISSGCYYIKNTSIMKKYYKELIEKKITAKNEYYPSLVYNLMVRDNLDVGLFEIKTMVQLGRPCDVQNFIEWSKYFKNKINKTEEKNVDYLNTALIMPLAGSSSDFSEYKLPKPLLDIDGEPMFVTATKQLPDTRRKIFIYTLGNESNYNISKIITDNFDKKTDSTEKYSNKKANKSIQMNLKGAASAIYTVWDTEDQVFLNKLNENPILISACDFELEYDQDKYDLLLKDETIDIIVFVNNGTLNTGLDKNSYSWLDVDENNFVTNVNCKSYPYDDSPLNHFSTIGTMFFRKGQYFAVNHNKCIGKNIKVNNQMRVESVLNECISSGLKIKMFAIDFYCDWGNNENYKTYLYWKSYFMNE